MKKVLLLIILVSLIPIITGCTTVNPTQIRVDTIEEVQEVLNDLYYFDLLDLLSESGSYRIEIYAVLHSYPHKKVYDYEGYLVMFYNPDEYYMTIRARNGYYPYHFPTTKEEIKAEYDELESSDDFISKSVVDEIIILYFEDLEGYYYSIFWINGVRYRFTLAPGITEDYIDEFISIVEENVRNRFKPNTN